MRPEEWKQVPGYEGKYEVSDYGRVKSVARTVYRPSPLPIKERILKGRSIPSGHLYVNLQSGGTRKNVSVHSLVAKVFIGPPAVGQEVRHLDGNPSNNHVANLKWGTRSENNRDRRTHGVDHEVNKTHCPRGHLLDYPNLRPGMSRSGHRGCLACNRAFARISYSGLPKSDMQSISDNYYRRIVGGDPK